MAYQPSGRATQEWHTACYRNRLYRDVSSSDSSQARILGLAPERLPLPSHIVQGACSGANASGTYVSGTYSSDAYALDASPTPACGLASVNPPRLEEWRSRQPEAEAQGRGAGV